MKTSLISFARLGLVSLCLFTLLWHPRLHASDDSFQVSKKVVDRGELGVQTNYTIVTGTAEITFSQFDRSTVEINSSEGKIKILPADRKSTMIIEVTKNNPALASEASLPELQKQVEERYPGARITPGTACRAGNGPAYSFDIERLTEYQTMLSTRLAFVPLPAGMLEVSVTTTPATLPTLRYTFAGLLSSITVKSLSQSQ